MNTTEDNKTGSVTTSAACYVVLHGQDPKMVQLDASVTLDKDVNDRLVKAIGTLKSDKDRAMHGIEVRYDCNSVTVVDSTDDSKRLAVSRLRVERTYYKGEPEISVALDVTHSAGNPIPSLSDYIEPSDTPESFTYLVQYIK